MIIFQLTIQLKLEYGMFWYLLLHWEEAIKDPFIVTSGKGDPLAKMARPSVNFWASSALHSALKMGKCLNISIYQNIWSSYLEVGLDNGSMTGVFTFFPIAFRTSAVKRPPHPDNPTKHNTYAYADISSNWPIRMEGLTFFTVSSRLSPSMPVSDSAKLERSSNSSSIPARLDLTRNQKIYE